jgi:DeoR/GlpR family transcriptional regulator of sugar metabolism
MSASAQQRRQRILDEIFARRNASVPDLAQVVEASEATVRRDLKSLADEGQIDLVYGGAAIRRTSDYSFRSKQQRNIEAKRIIGKLAADLVRDNDQVFLDSGTTCFEMAPFLKRKRGLSIIANSARLAIELDSPATSVILIGGQYRPDRMDSVGPLAASTLDQLRGYVCFLGADGVSQDFGPAAADVESAHLNRLAVLNSRETILVADQTKFAAPSLFKIVDWDRISRVVTDTRPDDAWMSFFESRGILVMLPESAAQVQPTTSANT